MTRISWNTKTHEEIEKIVNGFGYELLKEYISKRVKITELLFKTKLVINMTCIWDH